MRVCCMAPSLFSHRVAFERLSVDVIRCKTKTWGWFSCAWVPCLGVVRQLDTAPT